MNKKIVLTMVVIVIVFTCVFSFTACNADKDIYDAGEYGELDPDAGQPRVITHEGYRFLDWSEPVKQGRKTIYKAQYEHVEYFLTEVKDVYECPQNEQTCFEVRCRITNMQTMEVKETASEVIINFSTTDPRMDLGQIDRGIVAVNMVPKEFDGIITLTIDSYECNLHQEFNLHVVRNRIKAESIEISLVSNGENSIGVNDTRIIWNDTFPDNTSYKDVTYTVVEAFRNGKALSQDEVAEIVYFKGISVFTTENAQVGDIIRVQAYNERDPEVKSNILTIFVTED